MTTRVRLCQTSAVSEGHPLAVKLPNLPHLGVYEVGGIYYVNENLCTHGNALLTEGYQEGRFIECPLHGGMFDILTGEATAYPCQIPIRHYLTIIEDDWICIDASPPEE